MLVMAVVLVRLMLSVTPFRIYTCHLAPASVYTPVYRALRWIPCPSWAGRRRVDVLVPQPLCSPVAVARH